MTKEEMEQQIHSFAELIYKTGYDDGLTEGIKNTYNKGLNDVWEYVEKLGQLTMKEIYEIFGVDVEYDDIYGIIADYTPSEFIKAIKTYEEQEKEMRENCSILNDTCPYDIPCAECEVHCSVERAKQKLKGDKDNDIQR